MKSMKFAKRNQQQEIVITDVEFLQKENFEQRKEIQHREAIMKVQRRHVQRQKTTIKYLKAELKEVKAKKAMKAMKSMKAK